MSNWNYEGNFIESIENLPEGTIGFIYEVEFSNGMKYVGKKSIYHNRTLPPLKGYKRKRKTIVESDWKTYNGSNKELKDLVKEQNIVPTKKTILRACFNNWELTYHETRTLFCMDCLLDDGYYNSNILGKFYKPRTTV